ncbi:hypothetical protein [Microseira sp. BLCC-F43]|uniref:hypothetical protein n=1 Tax=Microseira sp. BLCC-F43 TaxID=3153602 RepID=UPI0035BA05BC
MDEAGHICSAWHRVARYLKLYPIPGTRLWQSTKALEAILTLPLGEVEHQPSSPVDIGTVEPLKSSSVTQG